MFFTLFQVMCLSVAVANVEQPKNEIELNVQLAANFLASLLKKNWQNIKVHSTYSLRQPTFQAFFFRAGVDVARASPILILYPHRN